MKDLLPNSFIPVYLKWGIQGEKDQGCTDYHNFCVLAEGNFGSCNQMQVPQAC